jgi:hypothetical protein
MEVADILIRFPRNYYMLQFDKARPLYAFFSERKGSKTSKIRKLTRKLTYPPFWLFLKILKSTMEVIDMLVRFPRNYYMLRFVKARPLYAFFSERKRVKNEYNP